MMQVTLREGEIVTEKDVEEKIAESKNQKIGQICIL